MEEDFDTIRFIGSLPETPADFYGNTTGGPTRTAVHRGGHTARTPGGMA